MRLQKKNELRSVGEIPRHIQEGAGNNRRNDSAVLLSKASREAAGEEGRTPSRSGIQEMRKEG